MERVLLGLKEASDDYRVSVPMLRVMIRKGKLPHVRCGRRVLIRKAILDWRSEAGNLVEAAPQEGMFQQAGGNAPIFLDKT